MKTIQELIKCAGRELGIRKIVYPKWMSPGLGGQPPRMKADQVRHEIDCMEQIYQKLKSLEEKPETSGELAFQPPAIPDLKGTFAVVLYLPTAKERDDLVAAVKASHPNMITRRL